MKWKIVADSGSNLTEFTLDNVHFDSVPLMINIGTNVFMDDKNLNLAQLLDAMEQESTASSSACPSPNAYAQSFEGAENVLCFTLSSGLSGSYNSAVLGKNLFHETHPNVNVHVFDTLSAGAQMDLLVKKAIELVQQGLSFDDVVNRMNEYHRNTDIVFMLENVDNLIKSGRLNKIIGAMIGMLGIRLIGIAKDGKIELANKAKGTRRALKSLLEEMEKRGYNGGRVIITHSFNDEASGNLRDLILSKYPSADVEITGMSGLCHYYAQRGGMLIGYEK